MAVFSAFLCCTMTGKAKQGLVKLLTTAVMVDNLAEKVDECPLIGVIEYCLRTIGTTKTVCYTK